MKFDWRGEADEFLVNEAKLPKFAQVAAPRMHGAFIDSFIGTYLPRAGCDDLDELLTAERLPTIFYDMRVAPSLKNPTTTRAQLCIKFIDQLIYKYQSEEVDGEIVANKINPFRLHYADVFPAYGTRIPSDTGRRGSITTSFGRDLAEWQVACAQWQGSEQGPKSTYMRSELDAVVKFVSEVIAPRKAGLYEFLTSRPVVPRSESHAANLAVARFLNHCIWGELALAEERDEVGLLFNPMNEIAQEGLKKGYVDGKNKASDITLSWVLTRHGYEWVDWWREASAYVSQHTKPDRAAAALRALFEHVLLLDIGLVSFDEFFFRSGNSVPNIYSGDLRKIFAKNRYSAIVIGFLNSLAAKLSTDELSVRNPMSDNQASSHGAIRQLKTGASDDFSVRWLVDDFGLQWEQWRALVSEYLSIEGIGKAVAKRDLNRWLMSCMTASDEMTNVEAFLDLCSFESYELMRRLFPDSDEALALNSERKRVYTVADFITWVIYRDFSKPDDYGENIPFKRHPLHWLSEYGFTMHKILTKHDPSHVFQEFILSEGPEWEEWRSLAIAFCSWRGSTRQRKKFTRLFLLGYLPKVVKVSDVGKFLTDLNDGKLPQPIDVTELSTKENKSNQKEIYQNVCCDFVDYLVDEVFAEVDDDGKLTRAIINTFRRVTVHGRLNRQESVRTPLPFTYIKELVSRVEPYPGAPFKEWNFMHGLTGKFAANAGSVDVQTDTPTGDWFEVDKSVIDFEDPDCVWRERSHSARKGPIYDLWSPVKAVALVVKMKLPLRTIQVRMLDSGEADTYRFQCGEWQLNDTHDFARGSERMPRENGVFRRISDPTMHGYQTGFYINTNKTADRNKAEANRGYVIPWQNDEVLNLMAQLRNWQEKYNPVSGPVSAKMLGSTEMKWRDATASEIAAMGEFTFLFRDASAKSGGKNKSKEMPFGTSGLNGHWYKMLLDLEERVEARGETLPSGDRIRFIEDRESTDITTLFNLHSLRVSLITAFATSGEVPIAILQKIAGHSRLIMTLYYTKISPRAMASMMDSAMSKLDGNAESDMRDFLLNATDEQLFAASACIDPSSILSARKVSVPAAWVPRTGGTCMAGGNNLPASSAGGMLGCWNGGQPSPDGRPQPVPHGFENCVQCRWFVTDVSHLPHLNALFNLYSMSMSNAGERTEKINSELEALEEERYQAELDETVFSKNTELKKTENRLDKARVEQLEWLDKMEATLRLVLRIVEAEDAREQTDGGQKVIAVGSANDVQQPVDIFEADSKLMQLCTVCEDAEIFPDIHDELANTPSILERSAMLNRALTKQGYEPIFLQMDQNAQLIAGNAFIRDLAKKASPNDKLDGVLKATRALRTGVGLADIMPNAIVGLETTAGRKLGRMRIGNA